MKFLLKEDSKTCLYKTAKQYEGKKLLIEVFMDEREHFVITAYDVVNHRMYMIDLPKSKQEPIVKRFGIDYASLCDNLRIMKEKLVL